MPAKKEKQPLSVTHPELAKEADGWDPSLFTPGSGKKMNWVCNLSHTWAAKIANRAGSGKNGCPYCTNSKCLTGYNDLKTLYPELAMEADGWDPSKVLAGGSARLQWKCSIGHIWETRVAHRTKSKSGCPYCTNKKVLAGFNDLATTHPELVYEADGWDPTTIVSGSDVKRKWKCSKGHVWRASTDARSGRGKTGCPVCSGNTVMAGFNDLATTHPKLSSEAVGWEAAKVSAGSGVNRKWRCPRGHIYSATVASRVAGSSCGYCTNRKALPGYNDLKTLYPEIAIEADGWDPSNVLAGSTLIKSWKCPEGHKWKVRVAHRTVDGSGCPGCTKTGFNPEKRGYIYLLEHPEWKMYQIGITNVPENRTHKHSQKGWKIIEIRGPMDGHLTLNWETDILRMLKAKGADLSNSKIAGKFDGYSEAWSKSTFEAKTLMELMRLTEEFEEKSLKKN